MADENNSGLTFYDSKTLGKPSRIHFRPDRTPEILGHEHWNVTRHYSSSVTETQYSKAEAAIATTQLHSFKTKLLTAISKFNPNSNLVA